MGFFNNRRVRAPWKIKKKVKLAWLRKQNWLRCVICFGWRDNHKLEKHRSGMLCPRVDMKRLMRAGEMQFCKTIAISLTCVKGFCWRRLTQLCKSLDNPSCSRRLSPPYSLSRYDKSRTPLSFLGHRARTGGFFLFQLLMIWTTRVQHVAACALYIEAPKSIWTLKPFF